MTKRDILTMAEEVTATIAATEQRRGVLPGEGKDADRAGVGATVLHDVARRLKQKVEWCLEYGEADAAEWLALLSNDLRVIQACAQNETALAAAGVAAADLIQFQAERDAAAIAQIEGQDCAVCIIQVLLNTRVQTDKTTELAAVISRSIKTMEDDRVAPVEHPRRVVPFARRRNH